MVEIKLPINLVHTQKKTVYVDTKTFLRIPYEKRYQNFIENPLWKGKRSKVYWKSHREKKEIKSLCNIPEGKEKGTFA